MKNLNKDIKSNRPLLIQPANALAFMERINNLNVLTSGAKVEDVSSVLKSIFGEAEIYETYPPYAIIPVKGVIGKSLSEMEKLCGCVDIEDVEEMIEEAENDSNVSTILFVIDSPGGCSVGVPELANRVRLCSKKTIAFTDSECCSAAYWIGSQCQSFYATPSSTVGSVGVYIAYPDLSQAYKMEGIDMVVIKAGKFKGAGIQGVSLDENQKKMLQDEVLEIWQDFKTAVTSVRSFVKDESMEGQTFSGKKGADAGLVTGLVNGFDELMMMLNEKVAEQMEADEDNDERHEEEIEEHLSASARALKGLNLKPKASTESEEDEEDEEDEEEDKGYPAQPETGKLPVKMKHDDDDDDDEDGEDGEEPEAEAKHNIVVSDFMETIKKHDDAESDEANDSVIKHLKKMSKAGRKIHIVSGRPESKRSEVSDFLHKHKVEHHALHLKPEEDKRSTPEYKVDVVKKLEKDGHHISHCIENDEACAEAYAEAGWHCVHPDTVKRMDESDDADDAVETDEKHNRKNAPRHKSRGVA